MINVDVKNVGIHSSESIFTIANVADRHTKYPIKQPMKRTFCEIFFAKIVVTKQKIRFVIIVEMPSDDIQNVCKSLNSNGESAQPAASEISSTIGIWRTSLSTLAVIFITMRAVVVSTATFVALAQSDFCSLVIQYSNGVMKKFHGSRVAMLQMVLKMDLCSMQTYPIKKNEIHSCVSFFITENKSRSHKSK